MHEVEEAFTLWYESRMSIQDTVIKLSGIGIEATESDILGLVRQYNWHSRAEALDLEEALHNQRLLRDRQAEVLNAEANMGDLLLRASVIDVSERLLEYQQKKLKDPTAAIPIFKNEQTVVKFAQMGIDFKKHASGLPEWVNTVVGAPTDALFNAARERLMSLVGAAGAQLIYETAEEETPEIEAK